MAINLFDFSQKQSTPNALGYLSQFQKKEAPVLNFGAPKSGTVSFKDSGIAQVKPTPTTPSSGGFSVIPKASAGFDEGKYLSKDKVKEIIDNRPQGVEPIDILTQLEQKGYIIEGYKSQQPVQQKTTEEKPTDDKGFIGTLSNIGENIGGVVEGAISQVPAVAGNISSFVNKNVFAPASGLAGDILGVDRENNIFYQQAIEDARRTKQLGESLKGGIKKYGASKDDTIGQKIGEEITNIGSSVLIPGGVMKAGVPLRNQILRAAGQGAIEAGKYSATSRGEMPTTTEALLGAGISGGLGVIGKTLENVKIGGQLAGLMNTAKLRRAKKMVIQEEGEQLGKELGNQLKTSEDVANWMLARNIKGSQEEIAQQLLKMSNNSKQIVDEGLLQIDEVIKASSKEMDNTRKALDLLYDAYKDDIGNQALLKQIQYYTKQLQKKGGGLKVSDMNDIKRLLDNSEITPYALTGKVRAGKSGLANIRYGLKTDIENIAARNGFDNVKLLNNETSVSRFLSEAISDKYDAQIAQNLLSVFNPRTAGVLGGGALGTTTGPFDSNTTEGKIGNFIVGAILGRVASSPAVTTRVANLINKITPSDKAIVMEYINSRGTGTLPNNIYSSIKELTKNLSNKSNKNGLLKPSNVNLSNNRSMNDVTRPLKKSVDISKPLISSKTQLETTLKGATTSNINEITQSVAKTLKTNKTAEIKAIIQRYLKEFGNDFKNKIGDMISEIAEKVGAKINLVSSKEGIGVEKTKMLSKSDDLISEAKKYKTFEEFEKSYLDKLKENKDRAGILHNKYPEIYDIKEVEVENIGRKISSIKNEQKFTYIDNIEGVDVPKIYKNSQGDLFVYLKSNINFNKIPKTLQWDLRSVNDIIENQNVYLTNDGGKKWFQANEIPIKEQLKIIYNISKKDGGVAMSTKIGYDKPKLLKKSK